MGLIGQVTQIGERVQEWVAQAFDEVGNYGVGLRAFHAIERLNYSTEREVGSDSEGRVRVRAGF